MDKTIFYKGSNYQELKAAFLEYFDERYIVEIFELIDEYKDYILEDEEKFEINASDNERKDYQGYNMIIPTTNYHINIKRATIVFLQIFGEAILQAKIAGNQQLKVSIIPSMIRLKECLIRLNEENGEVCVCKEIKCKKGSLGGWDDFCNSSKECVNNNLNCSFNHDGNCNLTKEAFENILSVLIEKKIVEMNNGEYKIVL